MAKFGLEVEDGLTTKTENLSESKDSVASNNTFGKSLKDSLSARNLTIALSVGVGLLATLGLFKYMRQSPSAAPTVANQASNKLGR